MNFRKEFKINMKLAYPVMLTQLGQIMVNVADSVMVGDLGVDPLASVSLGFSFFIEFLVLAFGFSFALSPLVAEADANNNKVRIQAYFTHSMWLNIGIALILILLAYLCAPIMYHINQPEAIIPAAQNYFLISVWSILPLMVFQTMRQYSEGISLTLPVTVTTLIANAINVLLNYGLIYGNWGMPRLEVEGAAWATLIARVLMIFLMIIVIQRWSKATHYLEDLNWKSFHIKIFKKLSLLGMGTSFQMFFEVSAFALAAIIIGQTGVIELSAHQIAINLASITFMFCVGLSVSSTIRVGNQMGRKDYRYLRDVGYSNILLVMIIMAVFAIAFIVLRNFFPTLYVDDPVVWDVAASLLIVAALFQLSDGIQVVCLGALRGMQDVKIPTWITFVVYYLITIPLGYYLAIPYGLKALGMWIALGIGLTISALALVFRFNSMSKRWINSNEN